MRNDYIKLKTAIFSILVGWLFLADGSEAKAAGAVMYLSPESKVYSVGESFTVAVKLDAFGQKINAAEGTIEFDSDIIEAQSVSKSNSIFNLWASVPAFSNTKGSITFSGGTTENYAGNGGTVVNVTFTAKSNGKSSVRFKSGSVLAADGKGTNILSNMISGSYAVQPKSVNTNEAEIPEPAYDKNAPKAPNVISFTNSDQGKWYSGSNLQFSWAIDDDITGEKMALDQSPRTVPAKYYKERLTEKKLENVGDGQWYFHLSLCNKYGCGPAAHFRVQIDSIKPEAFQIRLKNGDKTTNPMPTISFEAKDSLSGIDHYEIKTEDESWLSTDKTEYILPKQKWGKHAVLVKAIDKAANSTLAVAEYEILPLEAPSIIQYPIELVSGSYLSVKGIALPESDVEVYVKKEDLTESFLIKSAKDGKWSYVYNKPLEVGVYEIQARTMDANQALSDFSNKAAVIVITPLFMRIGKMAIDYLTLSLMLLALIFVILFGSIWAWEKIRRRIEKIGRKTTRAERLLFNAFKYLENEIEKEVANIDGNPKLNDKEKKVANNLRKALNNVRRSLDKEIKSIEKELEG